MNNKLTAKERKYLERIKNMACSVCGQSGPSDAHHIVQHRQYLCIPLCKDCHQGNHNGIHNNKHIWSVLKMTELDALNLTVERMMNGHG